MCSLFLTLVFHDLAFYSKKNHLKQLIIIKNRNHLKRSIIIEKRTNDFHAVEIFSIVSNDFLCFQ